MHLDEEVDVEKADLNGVVVDLVEIVVKAVDVLLELAVLVVLAQDFFQEELEFSDLVSQKLWKDTNKDYYSL